MMMKRRWEIGFVARPRVDGRPFESARETFSRSSPPLLARLRTSGRQLVCLLALLAGAALAAEDNRELAPMPLAAQATLRAEMQANLLALNGILGQVAAGKLAEAGDIAEQQLGLSAMGRNRSQPLEARPGAHMPPAMHRLAIDGHQAASEFARVAKAGDREQTVAALPSLTQACVVCHYAYRVR
jgi:hypothetical protein